jgi:hypothetical protein
MTADPSSPSPERDVLVQALITEAVSLGVMLAVLWALNHTADLAYWWWRLTRRQTRESAVDASFRQARRGLHDDIRRMEYGDA